MRPSYLPAADLRKGRSGVDEETIVARALDPDDYIRSFPGQVCWAQPDTRLAGRCLKRAINRNSIHALFWGEGGEFRTTEVRGQSGNPRTATTRRRLGCRVRDWSRRTRVGRRAETCVRRTVITRRDVISSGLYKRLNPRSDRRRPRTHTVFA